MNPVSLNIHSIADADKGYKALQEKKALGVVLNYLPKNDFEFIPAVKDFTVKKAIDFVPAKKEPLKVAVIGVDSSIKIKLLPIVSQLPGVKISAVADQNSALAQNVARMYGATKTVVEDSELVDQNLVDVVMVGASSSYAAKDAIYALSHGKALFVRKSIVKNFEQFEQLAKFLKQNPKVPLCIDYNRSSAPFVQKIKWEMINRSSPLMISYRMNVPKKNQDASYKHIGGGAIIEQAGHIFTSFIF